MYTLSHYCLAPLSLLFVVHTIVLSLLFRRHLRLGARRLRSLGGQRMKSQKARDRNNHDDRSHGYGRSHLLFQ